MCLSLIFANWNTSARVQFNLSELLSVAYSAGTDIHVGWNPGHESNQCALRKELPDGSLLTPEATKNTSGPAVKTTNPADINPLLSSVYRKFLHSNSAFLWAGVV
jgi:hypothetical protein